MIIWGENLTKKNGSKWVEVGLENIEQSVKLAHCFLHSTSKKLMN